MAPGTHGRARLAVPAGLFALWLAVQAVSGNLWTRIPYGYWQLLPLDALLQKPFSSILFLHSQPPALNVLLWLVHVGAKLPGLTPELAATLVYTVISAASCMFWHEVFLRCSGSRIAAGILTAVYLFNPAFVYFQNLFFYTHLVQFQMALLLFVLSRWTDTGRRVDLLLTVAVLALIVHTRSLWHPLFGMLFLVLVFAALEGWRALLSRDGLHRLGLAVALFVALVAPWMIKNQVLFGTASFSSWMGLSLRGEESRLFLEEREFDAGVVIAYYGESRMNRFERHPATGLLVKDIEVDPAMDFMRTNMNHLAVVPLGKRDTATRLAEFRERPGDYFVRCYAHLIFLDVPPFVDPYAYRYEEAVYTYRDPAEGVSPIAIQKTYDAILYGSWFRGILRFEWRELPFRPSLWILLVLPAVIAGAVYTLARPADPKDAVLAAGTLVVLVWFLAMIILVDGIESARMKWEVEGVTLAMACLGARRLLAARRSTPASDGAPH